MFSVDYDFRLARVTVTPIAGYSYYRIICRTGAASGSGTAIYDQEDIDGIYNAQTTYSRSFPVSENTTYTVNVLYYYGPNAASDYAGAMGAQEFTTPAAPLLGGYICVPANGGYEYKFATPYICDGSRYVPYKSKILG